ncbi:MAG: hypothetical protein ABIM85_07055 [candidate division WOR-3 bacterium]
MSILFYIIYMIMILFSFLVILITLFIIGSVWMFKYIFKVSRNICHSISSIPAQFGLLPTVNITLNKIQRHLILFPWNIIPAALIDVVNDVCFVSSVGNPFLIRNTIKKIKIETPHYDFFVEFKIPFFCEKPLRVEDYMRDYDRLNETRIDRTEMKFNILLKLNDFSFSSPPKFPGGTFGSYGGLSYSFDIPFITDAESYILFIKIFYYKVFTREKLFKKYEEKMSVFFYNLTKGFLKEKYERIKEILNAPGYEITEGNTRYHLIGPPDKKTKYVQELKELNNNLGRHIAMSFIEGFMNDARIRGSMDFVKKVDELNKNI